MKKTSLIFFILAYFFIPITIATFLTSCFDYNETTYWEEGVYLVQTDPGEPSCKVLYRNLKGKSGISRIECVSQIGSNDNFIIAKSEDNKYWILDKSKDGEYLNAEEIVEGPLSLEQFKKRASELHIDKLGFTVNF